MSKNYFTNKEVEELCLCGEVETCIINADIDKKVFSSIVKK